MSRTNVNLRTTAAARGFTLVEVVVAVGISTVVFAGILSGFTLLGRNFTRLVNSQEQQAKSRRAFALFSQDINAAIKAYNPLDSYNPLSNSVSEPKLSLSETSLSLAVPDGAGAKKVVSYVFDATAGTLTRTANAQSEILLTKLVNFDAQDQGRSGFTYFNNTGDPTAASISIKEIELRFTSTTGNSAVGTSASHKSASARLTLRNKTLLQ